MLALLALLVAPVLAQDPPPPGDPPPGEELPILAMPKVLAYAEAPYPEEAKAAGIEGTVRLLITIDETGKITDAEIVQGADHGFDEAALEAVWKMTFTPATTAEGPVPVAFEFDYGFVLEDEPPPVEAAPPPVNFEGQIREMGTRKLLSGVKVVVTGLPEGSPAFEATTDEEGRFSLRGVPTGLWNVRILEPGHVTLDERVLFEEGQITSANLWIRAEEYRENEAIGTYRKEEQEVTRRTLTIEEVRKIPGTFGDPVKVVQTLPGAARSPFGTGLLIIRGSNPEDSGVYVDGVRIPIIYHLTGTTSVLSPDIVESVDYLPGGFGTQYGRSMGGVVDVKTKRTFDESRLVWGTDILDSQVYFQGGVGKKGKKHGIAVGARRSYIDAFIPLFMRSDYAIKPRYWDYQLKWVPPVGEDRYASVFVYGFEDLLSASTPDDVAQGSDQDTQGDFLTKYSSQRVVGRFELPFTETLSFMFSPSFGYDGALIGLGNEFTLESQNWLSEVRAELAWKPAKSFELVPGMDLIGGWWRFDFRSPFKFTDLDDPLNERESVSLTGRGTGWGPDLYLKANVRPLKDPERLLLTPGVRANVVRFTYKGSVTGEEGAPPYTIGALDPRFNARFKIVDAFVVKGGSGFYNQPPQPTESVGVGTTVQTGFERAWSSTLGFEHQVSPAIQWELELFHKELDRQIVFNEAWTGFGDIAFTNTGIGRAYGLEFILRHAKTDRFFGWISYTLSRSWRCDYPKEECGPQKEWAENSWYPFQFDQPHIFSAQGGYDLPHDFTISAQVQYVTGNPDAPYNAGVYDADGDFYNPFRVGAYGTERLPDYFQSSVRVDRLWTFKKWQLSTYLDLINLVRGVNPEFTVYDYDYTEVAYVRGLPFIPNIGIEAKFHP